MATRKKTRKKSVVRKGRKQSEIQSPHQAVSPATREERTAESLVVGDDASRLDLVSAKRYGGSKYDDIFQKLSRLTKAGQYVLVPLPDDVTPRTFLNRFTSALNVAIKSGKLIPPKGHVFQRRTEKSGRIVAIILAKSRD